MEKTLLRVYETDMEGLTSEVTLTNLKQTISLLEMIDTIKTKLIKQLAEISGDKTAMDLIKTNEKLLSLTKEQREQMVKDIRGLLNGK